MAVAIRGAGVASNEALTVDHTRRLDIAVRIQVVLAANAAIDDGNSDSRAIPTMRIRDVRVDGGNHMIQGALHSAILRDIRNVAMGRQAREIRAFYGYELRLHQRHLGPFVYVLAHQAGD